MKTKFIVCTTLLIIFVGINSCSKSNSYVSAVTNPLTTAKSPGANEVWMQNTTFVPATKTIKVGTTITWTNKDTDTHDVKSSSGVFSSPSMNLNATFSYTFSTAGTYNYSCAFHAGMDGTIIVQ